MTEPIFVAKPGQIDYTHAKRAPVLNCVVKHKDKILLVKRNSRLRFHPGVWNGISGFLDEKHKTLFQKVKEELFEEAGIGDKDIISIEEGTVIEQSDPTHGKTWIVHPVLVEVRTSIVNLDWEAEEFIWIDPTNTWDFKLLPGFDTVIRTFFQNL